MAGAAGVGHSGAQHLGLAVTDRRALQGYRGGGLIMAGRATVGRVDAGQQIGVGVTGYATSQGRDNAAREMVKAMFRRLLLIQMTGQAVGRVRRRRNDIGHRRDRHLALAKVIDDLAVRAMADGAVTRPVQDEDLRPSIERH